MMSRKLGIVFIIVLIGGYFTVQVFSRDGIQEKQIVKNVKTEKVKSRVSLSTRQFSGVVGGEKEVFVFPKVSGYLVEMKKKEGDFVKKGDLLAIVDGTDLRLQSASAFDNVDALKKVLEKTERYYEQVVDETEVAVQVAKKEYIAVKDDSSSSDSDISIAKKSYDQAQESLESSKKLRDSQVQSIEAEISALIGQARVFQNYANNANVIAPFDGVIGRKMVNVGDMVSPSVSVYALISNNEKEIEIFAPGSVLQNLSLGQKVNISSDESEVRATGEISAISPSVDRISRKAVVKISVENDFSLGEFVVVDLPLEKVDDALMVPVQAIVGEYYDKFVFLVRDGVVEKRKVEIGNEVDGFVEIIEGVDFDEEVIVEGQFYLRNGDVVTVI